MPRLKRGKKSIGKPKRRTKHNLKAAADCKAVIPEHAYAMPTCTSQYDLVQSPCGYSGQFGDCMCILHYDEMAAADEESHPPHHDSDGFHADEYFLVFDGSVVQYKPEDNVNHLTLQRLQEDTITHEAELNKLNFDVLKTTEQLHLIQCYEKPNINMKLSLSVDCNLIPTIKVHGKSLPSTHSAYKEISQTFIISDLMLLAKSVSEHSVCFGNPDGKYVSIFSDKGAAYLEGNCGANYSATIRSDNCELLVLAQNLRCVPCQKLRGAYRMKDKRTNEKTNNVNILSSSRPNCSMNRKELEEKQKLLKAKAKELELQNRRLRNRIQLEIEKQATELNAKETSDIYNLVTEYTPQVEKNFEADSFQRIFWDEQIKYNQLKNKCSMRWHPLIVKWSLLLKSKSSKAYQAMKDSGFINLPSERTLYDYTHYVPSKMGFVPETIAMLVKECQEKGIYNEPWKSYVGLLQDEIKVKSDLVYCPTTGELVGYVNLDSTSNQIMELQNGISNSESQLATSALVLMVKGASSDLKFPLAAFSTNSLDSTQLYTILWRAIELLEIEAGLKVLFITCDGAGQNRKFFDMHRSEHNNSSEPVNFCQNPYADDNRMLYFISDMPHLLKTARNCFANSHSHKKSRHLWNNGYNISWLHIVNLYEQHIENNMYTKSNLNRAHIDLTSYSQMKVNLAAQVLSSHVATHLEQEYGAEVTGTVEFIRHVNKFFDCVNSRNLYEGANKRNPNLDPYTDSNDERLTWLSDTFLKYFDTWRDSVKNRPGKFSKEQYAKMQLSQQTLDGFKITVRSIVACVRHLLKEGAPFVLTEVFNQDALEQHFGHYRHKGGANDNPTIDNVKHLITTLRVVGSSALAPLRGNTKRRKSDPNRDTVNSPLPRKKSRPYSI
ncbi:uncharacterized protein [Amphiura filiformis]|uniref:uncharacterized protein n=1 Tax=Amphiura filiformis TaxID=82378 RepID=UPI003B2183A4